jgi:hypothetical protein
MIDIVDLDITSKAAITAVIAEGNMAGGTYGDWASYVNKYSADNLPEWDVDPVTGMHYLRCGIINNNATRIISWFLNFSFIKKLPVEACYLRYCLWLEDDIPTGMNELGVKLPGLASTSSKETLSLRMEHGKYQPDGTFPFVSYWYDAESGSGFGEVLPMGTSNLRVGRWYTIEQYIGLNSITPASGTVAAVANKDGQGKVWLDENLVWSTTAKRWRWFPETKIDQAHINIYHGGTTNPKGPIHYRIARIALSTQPIGMPAELKSGPIVVVTPPSPPEDTNMATQAQLDTLRDAAKAAYDLAVTAAADTTPDPRDAQIATLTRQLADAQAAANAAQTAANAAKAKLTQLNADIDAAQAKDA